MVDPKYSNISVPYIPSAERYSDLRKAFRTSQAYTDMIRQRWSREYLPLGKTRTKYNVGQHRALSLGDLVWLIDDSVRPCYYKLARVLETYPAMDGDIRSATVKTSTVIYKRPLVILSPLLYYKSFAEESRAGDFRASTQTEKKLKKLNKPLC